MKLAFGILFVTCLTVQARYYKNPFRRSADVAVENGDNKVGTEAIPSDVEFWLRNLIVGPPAGAPQIMLSVNSNKGGSSEEIAEITREKEKENEANKENKTERVINVVEDYDSGSRSSEDGGKGASANDDKNGDTGKAKETAGRENQNDGAKNEQKNGNESNGNATGNQSNGSKSNNNATGDQTDGGNASVATVASATNGANANKEGNRQESAANNANEANSNNNANGETNTKSGQQPEGNGSNGNNVTNNGSTAENNGGDNKPIEGQSTDGNIASVERSVRMANKSKADENQKSITGKYIAKTRGSMHVAPLVGHIHTVKSTNDEPAPGTDW